MDSKLNELINAFLILCLGACCAGQDPGFEPPRPRIALTELLGDVIQLIPNDSRPSPLFLEFMDSLIKSVYFGIDLSGAEHNRVVWFNRADLHMIDAERMLETETKIDADKRETVYTIKYLPPQISYVLPAKPIDR